MAANSTPKKEKLEGWIFNAQLSQVAGRFVLSSSTMKSLGIAANDLLLLKRSKGGGGCVGRAWPSRKFKPNVGRIVSLNEILQISVLGSIKSFKIIQLEGGGGGGGNSGPFLISPSTNVTIIEEPLDSFPSSSIPPPSPSPSPSPAKASTNPPPPPPPLSTPPTQLELQNVGGLTPPLRRLVETAKISLNLLENDENNNNNSGNNNNNLGNNNNNNGKSVKNDRWRKMAGIGGVLLYGPPGTGKTLIAKSLSSSLSCHLTAIDASDILGKYYGEAEQRIRDIFETALSSPPHIIFFDEIDALCPSRGGGGGGGGVGTMEGRIITTICSMMDKISQMEENREEEEENNNNNNNNFDRGNGGRGGGGRGVFVIGATNRVGGVDAALRRHGRFDMEIEIGVPNREARSEILQIQLKSVTHAMTQDDIENIASLTHGYVGADLRSLVAQATLVSLKRHKTLVRHENGGKSGENGGNLGGNGENLSVSSSSPPPLSVEDLKNALSMVGPSALRESAVEVPHVKFSQIGGQTQAKQLLKEAVEWPLKYPESFVRLGIRPPKGLLLYGPPGCSKTLMAKALATEGGLNFIAVKGAELLRKWVGESEKAVRSLFQKARQASPCIIFFDEIDALASSRGGGDSGAVERVVSQLLNELDGIEPLKNVIIIAATNRPDILDPALLRPGRIDRQIYISPPDRESREEILKISTEKMAVGGGVDLKEIAEMTDRFSGAELAHLCREAALFAMEENVEVEEIEHRHFVRAAKSISPGISPLSLAFYEDYASKH